MMSQKGNGKGRLKKYVMPPPHDGEGRMGEGWVLWRIRITGLGGVRPGGGKVGGDVQGRDWRG